MMINDCDVFVVKFCYNYKIYNFEKCINLKCSYLKYDNDWHEYYCSRLQYFFKDLDNLHKYQEGLTMLLKIYKTRNVKLPSKSHSYDAGIDLYIPNDFNTIVLDPNQSILIPSGIKIEIPYGYMGLFLNKSSVASSKKLLVGSQVVDCGYDGEVHIDLHNVGESPVILNPGDKIIQIVLIPILSCEIFEINEEDLLYNKMFETDIRKSKGFGSTGNN